MLHEKNPGVLNEFKMYADFSVRVDRYFHFVNIYGMHHHKIKFIYQKLPSEERRQALYSSEPDEQIRSFLRISASLLGYVATTNIFDDAGDNVGGDIGKDAINFALYTCYCFQWSLFEEFVKNMITKMIEAKVLPEAVVTDLRRKWRKTKQFFDKIDSGDVFGRSPFTAVLPVVGWVPSTEPCGYSDLDRIRDLRNEFIHQVESPENIGGDNTLAQRGYDRDMWILRKFAENVKSEVQRALGEPSS